MGRRRKELRNAADLILELCIIVAVRSENQFIYANFSAPLPHFWLVPPHFICSGDGTAREEPPERRLLKTSNAKKLSSH